MKEINPGGGFEPSSLCEPGEGSFLNQFFLNLAFHKLITGALVDQIGGKAYIPGDEVPVGVLFQVKGGEGRLHAMHFHGDDPITPVVGNTVYVENKQDPEGPPAKLRITRVDYETVFKQPSRFSREPSGVYIEGIIVK